MLKKIFARLKRWLKRQMASIDPIYRMALSMFLIIIMAFISLVRVEQLFDPHPPQAAEHTDGIRIPALQEAASQRDRSGGEIKAFESFLDSLRSDSAGRKVLDELLKKEPELAESLRKMESDKR